MNKKDYDFEEEIRLIEKYREKSFQSTGTRIGRVLYRKGLFLAKISERFDNWNYTYYYDFQCHSKILEKLGYIFFKKAARCFKKAAKHSNDLAVMNYALYLFTYENKEEESFGLFMKASELGLAVADYQLSVIYKNGLCGVEQSDETANFYFEQFKARRDSSERQFILSWDVDENVPVIDRSYMYSWFCGYSFPETFDTPSAEPSEWKYE